MPAALRAPARQHLPEHAQDIFRAAFITHLRRTQAIRDRRRRPTAFPGRLSSVPTSRLAIVGSSGNP